MSLIIPDFTPPPDFPKPPEVSEDALKIINQGGQILLPFSVGDAQITFASRWRLAEMIDKAIKEAKCR